jgi:hypothetical protein
MRLDPVFLLEPEPRQTRRALLIGACAAAVGGGLGLALGRATVPDAEASVVDPQLVWARELARDTTPILQLADKYGPFLTILRSKAPNDRALWAGVARLSAALLDDTLSVSADSRRRIAKAILAEIEARSWPRDLTLDRFVEPLRELAR